MSVAVYAYCNHEVTGAWYLPARHAPERMNLALKPQWTLLERFGTNLGFNIVVGGVLGIGPLATAALVFAPVRRPEVRVIAVSLLLGLSLSLAHNDTGIHVVGPIHFSDMLPHVIVLASAGLLHAGRTLLKPAEASPARLGALLAVYAVLAMGTLSVCHLRSLNTQVQHQLWFPAALEAGGVERAVVVTKPPPHYVGRHPTAKKAGSWVLYFPPPDPYLEEGIVYARWDADLKALRQAFKGWPVYAMTFHLGDVPDFSAPPVALELIPADFEGALPDPG